MSKCIELMPCDWLISNLCYQAIEPVFLIKWPVSVCVCVCVYIYRYIYINSQQFVKKKKMFKSDVDIEIQNKENVCWPEVSLQFFLLMLIFNFFTFNGNIWNYFLRWQLIKYDHVFFFSACSPHHFTLTHILLDAFNLEMYNSSSYCSIKGSHNLIFHPLMLQELHITLLAVHDGKRRSPVTVHMYPLCKKVQFKDKNKVNKSNITNVTFQFSFPENNFEVSCTKSYILY